MVQRQRWANGGLLILPKLWEQVAPAPVQPASACTCASSLLRVNYMASISWASFGLVFLLVYPFDSRLLSPLVLGAALPYFLAMGSDLRACGYRFTDMFRIYGFNLMLLPVNLAGVLEVDPAGVHRSEDPVRPHAEGAQPHRRTRRCTSSYPS